MNHSDNLARILDTLSKRYDKDFEVVQLTYEIDGERGNFYRAVCKEKGRNETFLAMYYLNGSDFLLADIVGKDPEIPTADPELVDDYPNMLFNLRAAEHITAGNPNILYTVADIGALGVGFTMDDLEKGVAECLSQKGTTIQAGIWLFVNDAVKNREEFEKALISEILSLQMDGQSIDIAYISAAVLEEIKEAYGNDTYQLEKQLRKDERVSRYSWYYAERDNGICSQEVVKEG